MVSRETSGWIGFIQKTRNSRAGALSGLVSDSHANRGMFWFALRACKGQHHDMGRDDRKQGRIFRRKFLCLWVSAVAVGVLSLSLTHLPPAGLVRELFIPIHSQSTVLLLAALIAQSSIYLAICVGVGLVAARRVGLGAPVLEAWLRGEPVVPYLRASAMPTFLTALLVAACTLLANSSVFHPDRRQDAITANEIMDSPVSAKLKEQIDKLGMAATKPLTPASLAILHLDDALGEELIGRLFEVSVVVLLFVEIFGRPRTIADRRFFWAAILIVALFRATTYFWVQHENSLMVSGVLGDLGLRIRHDPFWLAAARIGVHLVPPGLGFGFLYVRYGIESSVVANFAASVMASLLMNFWFGHFI